MVWYNDRRQGRVATAAIDAYCVAVRGRLNGTYAPWFANTDRILDLVDWLYRALQIHALTRRRDLLSEAIIQTFALLYERAFAAS